MTRVFFAICALRIGGLVDVVDVVRALLSVSLDQRDDLHFVRVAASALGLLAVVAPESLVHFDRGRSAAKLAGRGDVHGFADAVGHVPRGLVGDAEHAFELLGADALLAGTHQVRRVDPFMQGDLGALENGTYRDRVLLAAVAAKQQSVAVRFAGQARLAIDTSAVRANRAVGPAKALQVSARRVVIDEMLLGLKGLGHRFAPGISEF
jgi:hypothetical protein